MSDAPPALRLLSLAAHELRTPVGVIGGCLAMAQAQGQDPARRDRALAQASRNYERVVELLAEMSDLWRLDAGEATFNRHPLAPDVALRNAVRDTASRVPEGVALTLAIDDLGGTRVVADPVRLERALAAVLLAVARRATAVVGVAARLAGDGRRVQIVAGQDPTASWPPPPDTPRTGINEFDSGLGLSLPIARRVLETDGGALHALVAPDTFQLLVELAAAP